MDGLSGNCSAAAVTQTGCVSQAEGEVGEVGDEEEEEGEEEDGGAVPQSSPAAVSSEGDPPGTAATAALGILHRDCSWKETHPGRLPAGYRPRAAGGGSSCCRGSAANRNVLV